MKRIISAMALAVLLSGCADFAASVTNTIDAVGLTPDYAKGLNDDLRARKVETPSVNVADNVPEGKLVERYADGTRKFETIVKNRCFDEYIDIYYPNGKLRTHTPLVNCKAQGESQGYTEDGKLRTVINYKDGLAEGDVVLYDAEGKVNKTVRYHAGYPASKS